MELLRVLVFASVLGFSAATAFTAVLNMGGVTGSVDLDSQTHIATVNVSGHGTCSNMTFYVKSFPVMLGRFANPCEDSRIGRTIYSFPADAESKVNVSGLFSTRSRLEDLSLSVRICDGRLVCSVIREGNRVTTRQARFTGPIAGPVYLRSSNGSTWILADLLNIDVLPAASSVVNTTLYGSTSTAASCELLLKNLSSTLTSLGTVVVGSPTSPQKSRLELTNFDVNTGFLLYPHKSSYKCAKIYAFSEKQVTASVNMKGIKGHFTFTQMSPFDVTKVQMRLENLQGNIRSFMVHHFPVPYSLPSGHCSNDNIGGLYNPFNINSASPTYGSGSTHDNYELGDLSSRHTRLTGMNESDLLFTDFNLPLFGQKSIVGRSVVIFKSDGSRYACASIGYPGEVHVARARFQNPVVGDIFLVQEKDSPLSDVSIFLDLSYGNASKAETRRHNWHVHSYPISSERDDDKDSCSSVEGHWNPFNADTGHSNYATNCGLPSSLACEMGDLSGKHSTVHLDTRVGGLGAKAFFTDTFLLLPSTGAIGRSIVIHEAEKAGPRLACANLTEVQIPKVSSGSWHGPGTSDGQILFSQSIPEGPTIVKASLTNLNQKAHGYHVHVLPLKDGSGDPCSEQELLGHFNPLNWNSSLSPAPGSGTFDQYEIGDLGGKYGRLHGLNELKDQFPDTNLPITGQNSIAGRSLVIHDNNGTRIRCTTLSQQTNTGGHWTTAKAVFSGAIVGTIKLRQQMVPRGSSFDTTLEVDLHAASKYLRTHDPTETKEVQLFIKKERKGNNDCGVLKTTYNPFQMPSESSTCSGQKPLSCVLGEVSGRHGAVSLENRQLLTDSMIQLTGDTSVVGRAVLIKHAGVVVGCADIVPESPSALQTFPKVSTFYAYDFRKRVSGILKVDLQRVTVLFFSPIAVSEGRCQEVKYIISGDVDQSLLDSIKTHDDMGPYMESKTCSGLTHLVSSAALIGLMFVVAVSLPFHR